MTEPYIGMPITLGGGCTGGWMPPDRPAVPPANSGRRRLVRAAVSSEHAKHAEHAEYAKCAEYAEHTRRAVSGCADL